VELVGKTKENDRTGSDARASISYTVKPMTELARVITRNNNFYIITVNHDLASVALN
jgi:hypothetical protein